MTENGGPPGAERPVQTATLRAGLQLNWGPRPWPGLAHRPAPARTWAARAMRRGRFISGYEGVPAGPGYDQELGRLKQLLGRETTSTFRPRPQRGGRARHLGPRAASSRGTPFPGAAPRRGDRHLVRQGPRALDRGHRRACGTGNLMGSPPPGAGALVLVGDDPRRQVLDPWPCALGRPRWADLKHPVPVPGGQPGRASTSGPSRDRACPGHRDCGPGLKIVHRRSAGRIVNGQPGPREVAGPRGNPVPGAGTQRAPPRGLLHPHAGASLRAGGWSTGSASHGSTPAPQTG